MKHTILFLSLIATFGYSKTFDIPLKPKNSDKFYLYNAQIKNNAVKIADGDSAYRNVPNSLFFSFEKDSMNSSNILENNVSLFKDHVFGKSSGLFYDPTSTIRFQFPTQFDYGMVIEFWIKPFSVQSGSVLSANSLGAKGKPRSLDVYFKAGKLYFVFDNLFVDNSVSKKSRILKIASDRFIPLKTWSHHRITYNPSNGQINYSIDNEIVSQIWATKDGQPDSSVMYLNSPSDFEYTLGNGYRGLMDNFFISADLKNTFDLNRYDPQNSLVQTRVLKLKGFLNITQIELLSSLKKNTYASLQYRSSNEPFYENTSEEIISWQDYNLEHQNYNQPFKSKYIQFKINLFASPDGKKSPAIKGIRIKYDPIEVPSIPLNLAASSSDGKVTLSFRENFNKGVKAYKIYYGLKENNYWGQGAQQGSSPIIVSASDFEVKKSEGRLYYTIKGLDIFQVYFFRISAINEDDLESKMSEEISTRVMKLK